MPSNSFHHDNGHVFSLVSPTRPTRRGSFCSILQALSSSASTVLPVNRINVFNTSAPESVYLSRNRTGGQRDRSAPPRGRQLHTARGRQRAVFRSVPFLRRNDDDCACLSSIGASPPLSLFCFLVAITCARSLAPRSYISDRSRGSSSSHMVVHETTRARAHTRALTVFLAFAVSCRAVQSKPPPLLFTLYRT